MLVLINGQACTSFIQSMRHEGWRVVETRYDDGGYSGGDMNRPGLTRLLADLSHQAIDMVVEQRHSLGFSAYV